MSGDESGPPRSLRAVGDLFGDFARRVGELVSEVSETVTMPDELRAALEAARTRRFAGEWVAARDEIVAGLEAHPGDENLRASLALCLVHANVLAGSTIGEEDAAIACPDGDDGAACHLLRAATVRGTEPESALDALRRCARALAKAPVTERDELELLAHVVAALAYDATGERDRAVREAFKARAGLPPEANELRRRLLHLGARLLAAEDRLLEAERWISDLGRGPRGPSEASSGEDAESESESDHADDGPAYAPETVRLLARVAAARGDRSAAATLAALGEEGTQPSETEIRVGLAVGEPDRTRGRALEYLRAKPDDATRLRLWALAEARTWDGPVAPDAARGVIEALRAAQQSAPIRLRLAHAHELACVALRADLLDPSLLAPELRLAEARDAPPELRILAIRGRIRRGGNASADFEAGPPVRLSVGADLVSPVGPDESSPLRDPRRRGLEAQRALTLAEFCLQTGQRDQAQAALVEALVQMPQLARPAALLQELAPQPAGPRLEDALSTATELLAGVPASVLGFPLDAIPTALSRVIAARERLARPLTIAIMGEFSSGKSTFVNALLGEDVAPTGALPTTSTINVFRHGPSGRARVFYRDERISTLERDDVRPFLHGLDATEASRIRYVEIERAGSRLGDAAVVDTPGLNALDPFHEKIARDFIEEADAVVWIFSATRSGAASEASILTELREGGRRVLGVLNKVDTLEGGEQEELSAYLQQQLGDVLVGVVPLAATAALAWRTGSDRSGTDPFAAVDDALERSFLVRARELKRELTARRLREALAIARADVVETITALEGRAAAPTVAHDPAAASEALDALAQRTHGALLDLDDLLVRESLALGVLSVERAKTPRSLDVQDAAYLDSVLEEAVLRTVATCVGEISTEVGPTLPVLIRERFVPWARGYLAARTSSRLDFELSEAAQDATPSLATELHRQARGAHGGESALRQALRLGLRRLADDFRRQLRGLHRELDWASFFARQRSTSAPRAEALRLRTAVLAGIDALAHHADGEAGDRHPEPGA